MKTCIYVFSGTGTALAVSKTIVDQLGDATITLIPKALAQLKEDAIQTDASVVGFVFPNYFGGDPQMVLDFVQKLNLENVDYIFSVVTGGGGHGLCFEQLQQALAGKGKQLNYGKSIIGFSNYIVGWYYTLTCKTGSQLDQALRQLEQKAISIAADVSGRKREIDKDQHFSYWMSQVLSSKKITKDTRTWDKEFSIDVSCTGCGICSKVCQVQNIAMVNKEPAFQHNCQRCMACFQYCPMHAIQYKCKMLNKPRYTHPDYPANDMIKLINSDVQ